MSDALPTGYIMRPPTIDDLPAIVAIEAEAFADPWASHLYLQELDQPLRFQRVVVSDTGFVVAYLFAIWQFDELHILKVATHPIYAGRQIATTLLAAARDEVELSQGRGLLLEVRPSNYRAIQLYHRIGYHTIGRRPGYYVNGEDALVMQFELQLAAAQAP
ncbi:MAG: ribosomal protein S18-alanine N-acetyltransferase [Acidobacteria bacterium]|nr:ribosomal protein S18-alanine N-acetyltransferase [Acidobacteriota bacterium]